MFDSLLGAFKPMQRRWFHLLSHRCQLKENSTIQKRIVNQSLPRSRNNIQTKLSEKYNMEWPKITLFGDSITRRSQEPENGCWASYIAHDVGSFFDVDVRGFDGYNSKWALELLPSLFPKSYLSKVDIFIPFFGHNDSFNSKSPLHVPVDQYKNNMHSIIQYLLNNGLDSSKIIMISPTWYYDEDFQEFLKSLSWSSIEKSVAEARRYSDTIKLIAREENIEILDYFEYSLNYQPLKELFCDGIHYSQIGAKRFYESLMPMIEKKIEKRYQKPLADLWHVTPYDLRHEVKLQLDIFRENFNQGS